MCGTFKSGERDLISQSSIILRNVTSGDENEGSSIAVDRVPLYGALLCEAGRRKRSNKIHAHEDVNK